MRLGWIERIPENFSVAIDALRVSKLRSALTILGVVIGVSTVMAMAAVVQGIRDQIVATIEIAGPTTFYVIKYFSQTPVNPNQLPLEVRIRPDLEYDEAERLQSLPEISYASLWSQTFGRIEYAGVRTQNLTVMGADDRFPEVQGGGLTSGRWFTQVELSSGGAVAVIAEDAARHVFGRELPLGKTVRVSGRPVTVIGIYQPPDNIFAPPGTGVGAIVPFRLADRQFTIDRTNGLMMVVKPRAATGVALAQDAVTVALREMRRLRPADRNTFDLVSQDQILDIWNKITGVFFLVMIVLSAVALMVGGIGVMAMMMVSVTQRTREIGVRKALGATRRDIHVQFLVEAGTLTGIGGLLGIVFGLAVGRLITTLMNVDATTPLSFTVIAVVVSVGIGIVFGFIPAHRAARLDPIEALRYE